MTTNTSPLSAGAWRAPHLLTVTATQYYGTLALLGLAAIAVEFVDTAALKPAADRIFHQTEVVSWAIAALLALTAMTAMAWAGHLHRAAHTVAERRASYVLVIAWVMLGASIFVMRLIASGVTTASTAFGDQTTATDAAPSGLASAMLLGLIFAASGLLAYFEGRHINVVAIAYLRAVGVRARVVASVIAQRGLVARNAEDLERARGALEGMDESRREAERAIRHFGAELMADARIRIATHIGDPAATGMTTIEPDPHPATSSDKAGDDK